MNAAKIFEQLTGAESNKADTLELALALMREFGGPQGLAREAKLTYDDAPEGSQNRIRLLTATMELINRAHPLQEQRDPMAGLTDAELKGAISQIIHEATPSAP